jgi:beta-glucosidase
MPYAIYPEGLYDAISNVSKIGVPIYITENGIADELDSKRELFIRRYVYALSKAIEDGYDVRGYYYWTLMDNFEWDMGYKMRFGLYAVNFETQEAILRNGARCYKEIINSSSKSNKKL